jgi:hypothetical protein
LIVTSAPIAGITCASPINSGPQHFVLNAAFAALNESVTKKKKLPPQAPRLDVVAGSPRAITRDANGNALDGIRTPSVDVPIAALSGLGQRGTAFCSLFGTTVPFDSATLASLYPKHTKYVSAVRKATNQAVKAGFLLRPDAKLIKASAKASSIGN